MEILEFLIECDVINDKFKYRLLINKDQLQYALEYGLGCKVINFIKNDRNLADKLLNNSSFITEALYRQRLSVKGSMRFGLKSILFTNDLYDVNDIKRICSQLTEDKYNVLYAICDRKNDDTKDLKAFIEFFDENNENKYLCQLFMDNFVNEV